MEDTNVGGALMGDKRVEGDSAGGQKGEGDTSVQGGP